MNLQPSDVSCAKSSTLPRGHRAIMTYLFTKLFIIQEVKDFSYLVKSEVAMQARTCYLRSRSQAIEAVSRLILLSFSDEGITLIYLVKRDFHCWTRTCDLECHRPAWSHGAIEPSDGRDLLCDLEYSSSSSFLLALAYEDLNWISGSLA